MALPSHYLTSTKNLDGIFSAITTAQAPQRFTLNFLENLGYKSSSDRLILNVLKALGFLTADGSPTERYFRFLDQTESGRVLAEALQDAYADLYQINRNAHTLSRTEIKNKMRTLTQGRYSDDVLNKMAGTFLALARHADFEAAAIPRAADGDTTGTEPPVAADDMPPPHAPLEQPRPPRPGGSVGVPLSGLVYNIQIQLPESRDQAVYDALFRSLKAHLFE